MEKVTVAGVSRLPSGVLKVRFGNDITRVKVMAKNGDTDINLMPLPEAMEKGEAIKYLMTTDLMNDAETANLLHDASDKYNGKPATSETKPRKPRAPKVKAEVSPEDKLNDLKARAAKAVEAAPSAE